MQRKWTAVLMTAGALVGAALAVTPIWYSMQRYTEETGYDAGNAGVLFCCTVPTFPMIGIAIGAAIGRAIDRRS